MAKSREDITKALDEFMRAEYGTGLEGDTKGRVGLAYSAYEDDGNYIEEQWWLDIDGLRATLELKGEWDCRDVDFPEAIVYDFKDYDDLFDWVDILEFSDLIADADWFIREHLIGRRYYED